MKRAALPFILASIIISACASIHKRPENTSSAKAAYNMPDLAPARMPKEKKVKMKYSKPKGYSRSNRGTGKRG
jgi:hypothetical protein